MEYTEKQILLKLLEITPINSKIKIYSFDPDFEVLIKPIASNEKDDYYIFFSVENKSFIERMAREHPIENMIAHMYFFDTDNRALFHCLDFFSTIIMSQNIAKKDFLKDLLNDGCGLISTDW